MQPPKPIPAAKVEQPEQRFNNSTNCKAYENIVKQYDWNATVMLAIMRAESRCDPNADNTGLNKDGSVDIGLLQINSIHGYSKAQMTNPYENIKAGYKIWKMQGYRAWSAYNNKSYAKFL